MKKILLLASIVLIGGGCVASTAPEQAQIGGLQVQEITVERESILTEDAPIGHKVILSGAIDKEFVVLNEDKASEDELLDGEEIGRDGFYWAGIQDDLIFIRKDSLLQVQRLLSGEDGYVGEIEVMRLITLPANIDIKFIKNENKEEVVIKNNETRWELVSGDPNQDCGKPVWNGLATLKGWYDFDEETAAKAAINKEPFPSGYFKVSPEDSWKLPVDLQEYSFYLKAPDSIKKLVENSTEENPVSLTVKGFSYYCEGSPTLSTEPIE